MAPIVFAAEPDVFDALQRFRALLVSDVRLAVPLASRQSFPFADSEYVLVDFADASGLSRPGEIAEGRPGYGAWAVRGRVLYIIHGLWTAAELDALSISVLEFVISYWAAVILIDIAPHVSHLLEFSDNTGTEWSMRRETPSTVGMQTVAPTFCRAEVYSHVSLASLRLTINGLTGSAGRAWTESFQRPACSACVSSVCMSLLRCAISVGCFLLLLRPLLRHERG